MGIPPDVARTKGINAFLSLTHFPLTYTNSKDHRDDKLSLTAKADGY